MSKSRLTHAATEHCEEVFEGVARRPDILRAVSASHQAFRYGAIWQRKQDDCRIRGLKSRITNLLERLEESYEHGFKQTD